MKHTPYLLLLLLLLMCSCSPDTPTPPPGRLASVLSGTEPALLVHSGTNRYVLVHYNSQLWSVYPVVEQEQK